VFIIQIKFFLKKYKERERMKGCLIALGIVIGIFLIITGIVAYKGYSMYKEAVTWTDDKPVELNIPEFSEEKKKSANDKFKLLIESVDKNIRGTYSFNADELNVLIAEDPAFSGKAVFDIKGDEVGAKVSFPLDMIPGFNGRYLNGDIKLTAGMENGQPVVRVSDLIVNGKHPPEDFLEGIRKTNALDGSYKDPKRAKVLNAIKNITVENGIIKIEFKGNEPSKSEQQ
jgi:hypothetical protein